MKKYRIREHNDSITIQFTEVRETDQTSGLWKPLLNIMCLPVHFKSVDEAKSKIDELIKLETESAEVKYHYYPSENQKTEHIEWWNSLGFYKKIEYRNNSLSESRSIENLTNEEIQKIYNEHNS